MKPKNLEHHGASLRSSLLVPSSAHPREPCFPGLLELPQHCCVVQGTCSQSLESRKVKGLASFVVDFSGLKKMLLCVLTQWRWLEGGTQGALVTLLRALIYH